MPQETSIPFPHLMSAVDWLLVKLFPVRRREQLVKAMYREGQVSPELDRERQAISRYYLQQFPRERPSPTPTPAKK